MLLEFVISYAVAMLALVLAIGAINIYYFLDLVLQKENREKLYTVWLLALSSLAVHASFHIAEITFGETVLVQAWEMFSLSIGVAAIGILAKSTLSSYTFVETKKRLETATQERTRELEEKMTELSDTRSAVLNMLDDLEASHDELKTAYEELQTLDKMKDEFFSNVSHELRTPLTSIKGSLDLLTMEEISEEQRELVSLAKHNTNRLNALVGDILYYAGMEYGAAELNKEELDLGGVIESSVKAISPMALDSGITIETSIEGDLRASVDKNAMYKVLLNLLNNAVKFNKRGGKVMVSARGGENGRIRVSVSDTGIGMPKEQLDKIFNRFYQVDGSTTRRYPGTGLGLSLVKGIVKKHGGKIWVESEVGKGSKFTFEIPKGDSAVLG
ncbi:MAG: sensor histidine kinase [Candidatus Hydrothermarchaeaceae archaeon]